MITATYWNKKKVMAKTYTPSEFLKEKKLREIRVEPEAFAKFKEALSNHLPTKPDNDPESNYEDNVKAIRRHVLQGQE